ncbi:hypothetical protein LWI29_033808 [Acer saccharum]|uniref:Uncharacterized protein n=1 Tax=Acer saccharum TaxID=4024 RepID=A0AA39T833_ACESA|nr:hypothetical protein LWI29_033808 [Acer saccharum]
MGIYEVEFQGTKVKAILLDSKIAEFKTKGVLFWVSILSLAEVLSDRNLCFVGIGIRDKIPGLTLESEYWKSVAGEPLSFYMSAIVEVCDLAAKVLKKPKLCKCGLAEVDEEVRINSTVPSTASSTLSCPVTDSKVKVEIASLPDSSTASSTSSCPVTDSKVTVEIASLPNSKVKVEKSSLPEMIERILDWKAMAFSDEEIKYAIYDAHTCCVIGYKMLELLDATN